MCRPWKKGEGAARSRNEGAGRKILAGREVAIPGGLGGGRPAGVKVELKEAFEAAGVKVEVELYATSQHGWCVSDMPVREGAPIYNRDEAERAWAKLLALYKTALT